MNILVTTVAYKLRDDKELKVNKKLTITGQFKNAPIQLKTGSPRSS